MPVQGKRHVFGEIIIRWLIALNLMLASLTASADSLQKPVIVSAGKIPHVFDAELPGSYNRIFELMTRGVDRPMEIRYFPLSQAMQRLQQPEFDCFAMALKYSPNWSRLGMNAEDYTFIGPIAWLEIKLYVRAEDAGGDIGSLHEKPIATDTTIVNLRGTFDKRWASAKLTGADSFVDALDLLVAGHASAALAYDVDVRALGADHRLAGKFVDTNVVVSRQQDGMVCKSTADLMPVILGLQAGLDRITDDGTLGRLLGEPE